MSEDSPAGQPLSALSMDELSAISPQSYQEYLKLLQELSLAFIEPLDEQEVLKALMERATSWLDIPRAELYLLDETKDVLESQILLHEGELVEHRGHVQARGEGLAGMAWETGQAQLIHDYFNWSGCVANFAQEHADPETGEIPRISVISVPLKVRSQVIGVMDLVSKDPDRSLGETELRLLERLIAMSSIALENARLYRRSNQANQAKSEFLARISHELRTPLNTILGYVELLHEELEDVGMQDLLDDVIKIHQAGKHVLSLINQLLDLSKIEAGKMECSWEDVVLPAFLSQLSDDVKPLAAKQQNTFALTLQDGLEHFVTDPLKLRQILLNLLGNAAKFTQRGEIRLTVTARTEATPTASTAQTAQEAQETATAADASPRQGLAFRVEDNGIGMTPEELSTLFDTYSQGAQSRHITAGTGLGMTISKELCELMGGTVVAESEPGHGTIIEVWLPHRDLPLEEDAPTH